MATPFSSQKRSCSVENWNDLAQNSRQLANSLVKKNFHRSAISRAYYATYSKVTNDLVACGVSMPAGREGPNHNTLRSLIIKNLTTLNPENKRRALSRIVGRLYDMRIEADYKPSSTIDDRDVREAIGLMDKVWYDF